MIVDDLKDLCRIWDLAALDSGSTCITLKSTAEGLTAQYSGIHIGVRRKLRCPSPPKLDITVDATTLRDTLGILPAQAEVKVHVTAQKMQLVAGSATANLVLREGSEDAPIDGGGVESPPLTATVDRSAVSGPVNILAQIAARRITQLILTGINLHIKNGAIILRASDGSSTVSMTAIPTVGGVDAAGGVTRSMTPLAADLAGALALLSDDEVQISIVGKKLHLRDSRTDIYLSGLAGAYPNLDNLPKKFPSQITLEKDSVQATCRAASLFDSNKLVHIEADGLGTVVYSTIESEVGSFVSSHQCAGALPLSLDLDAEILSNIITGDTQMYYEHGRALIMLVSQNRYTWLSPVLRH